MQQVENQIRAFIAENFLFEDNADGLAGDASLLEGGVIDSTGVLELVSFLEKNFDFRVADEEVLPANFDTIDSLVAFVSGKLDVGSRKMSATAAN